MIDEDDDTTYEDRRIETYQCAEFYCEVGNHTWEFEGVVELGIGERHWKKVCPEHSKIKVESPGREG